MKFQLFQFQGEDGRAHAGVRVGERHLTLAGMLFPEMLANWAASLEEVRLRVNSLVTAKSIASDLDPARLRFLPSVPAIGTVYGAGANYRDHVEAMSRALGMKLTLDPKSEGVPPWHFIKPARATLAAHGEEIAVPEGCLRLDYEAELAVVIGRRAWRVPVSNALDHVAGYTCANDLSARDLFVRRTVDLSSPFHFDWIGHKVFAGSCPLGPYLTPAEFVESPESLGVRLWVNGEKRQDGNTANHLYGVAEQIAHLTARLELFPGDVILTGTPAGVGAESGRFLQGGDVVRVEIDGLGALENRFR